MALNYHHLHYFWVVQREGALTRAARRLRVSAPTISVQIQALEAQLGTQLFDRRGRRLVLTDAGRVAFDFADRIFALGQELERTLSGLEDSSAPIELQAGVVDVVPKLIAHRLLLPVRRMVRPVLIRVREGQSEALLEQLRAHELDVVITDRVAPQRSRQGRRVFSHDLGSFELGVFAAPKLAQSLRPGFPASLNGAPFLAPAEPSALREDLDRLFARRHLEPRVVAEFDDSALLKAFAHDGAGFVVAARVLESELGDRYGLVLVGPMPGVLEQFFAFTAERTLAHPAVKEIVEAAQIG